MNIRESLGELEILFQNRLAEIKIQQQSADPEKGQTSMGDIEKAVSILERFVKLQTAVGADETERISKADKAVRLPRIPRKLRPKTQETKSV